MEICRLCFEYNTDEEEFDKSNEQGVLEGLQQFIPLTIQFKKKAPIICESCANSIQTSKDLISRIKVTESKITYAVKNSELDRIDINTLHEKVNALPLEMKQCVTLCRLCLSFIPRSKIYLCENNSNVLHYTLLKDMLEFCQISVNLELTEKPAMCPNCWEYLQIAYSFKKNFLDIEKQIKIYTRKCHLRNNHIDKDMMVKIKQYLINKEEQSFEDSEEEPTESNLDMKRIKFEHSYIKPTEIKPKCPAKNHRKKLRTFSKEEDQALVSSYFEVTGNEQNFYPGYWKKIHSMWLKLCLRQSISICSLQNRLSNLLRNKIIPLEVINKIKVGIASKKDGQIIDSDENMGIRNNKKKLGLIKRRKDRYQKKHDISCDNNLSNGNSQKEDDTVPENNIRIRNEPLSDSDDTFVEEATKSSFTPHIKTEPLSDSDSEIDVVEPRIERFSDKWDSLPQLERMDIPPMTIRIDKIYSLDEKKSALIPQTSDLYRDPNIEIEEVKTCRKFSFKNQMDQGLFKCLACNFETKSRRSADIHSRWHSKGTHGKKLHCCQICQYKISNKKLLKIHERLHKEENDIPILLPIYT